MVEVVGSDVFVDGVGGHEQGLGKEGMEREIETLRNEGQVWDGGSDTVVEAFQEMKVLSGERVEHGLEEEKVHEVVRGSSSGETGVVSVEKLEVKVTEDMVMAESVADKGMRIVTEIFGGGNGDLDGSTGERDSDVLDDEVSNPGIESVEESCSKVPELAHTPVTTAETTDKVASAETSDNTIEAAAMMQDERDNKEEVLHSDVGFVQDGLSNNIGSNGITKNVEGAVCTPFVGGEAAMGLRDEDSRGREEALSDGVANTSLHIPGEEQCSVIGTTAETTDKVAGAETSGNPIEAAAMMPAERVDEEEVLHSDVEFVQDDVSNNIGSSGIAKDVEGAVYTPFVGEEATLGLRDEDSRGTDEAPSDGVADTSLLISGEEQRSVIGTITESTDKVACAETSDNPIEVAEMMQVEVANEKDVLHSDVGFVQDDGISKDVEGASPASPGSKFHIDHVKITQEAPVVQDLQPVSGGEEELPAEGQQQLAPIYASGGMEDQKLTIDVERNFKNDTVLCSQPETSILLTQVVDGKETPLADGQDSTIKSEEPSSEHKSSTCFRSEESYGVKVQTTCGGHGVQPQNLLSSDELSFPNEKSSDTDSSNGMLGCSKNEEYLKAVNLDESSENDGVHGCISSVAEPTETTCGGTVQSTDQGEDLKLEGQFNVKGSPTIATDIQFDASTSLTSIDNDILHADTGASAENVWPAEGEGGPMDEIKTSNSGAESLEGDASNPNDDKLTGGLAMSEGDMAATTDSLSEHIDTEIPEKHETEIDRSVVAEQYVEAKKQVSEQLAEPLIQTVDPCLGDNLVISTDVAPVSEVDITVSTAAVCGEDNSGSSLPEGSAHGINNEVSPHEVEITVSDAAVSGEDNFLSSLPEGNAHGSNNDVSPLDVQPILENHTYEVINTDEQIDQAAEIEDESFKRCDKHDVSPQDVEPSLEIHTYDVINTDEPVDQAAELEDQSCKTDDKHVVHEHATDADFMEQEVEIDTNYPVGDQVENSGEGIEADQHSGVGDDSNMLSDKTVKHCSSVTLQQSGYLLPPENEGEFSVSDLVWGKVRSHPWWPGQIFDPADASEKAVKYFKKDCFLVAYFGDQTFAWNDPSVLKPFRSHFSMIEKQSNSEAFQSAVSSALAEVSRRVELGLACSCIPEGDYSELEYQIVENTGIRDDSSKRIVKDKSCTATSFEPDKLVDYVSGLAMSPTGRIDQLDLSIAQAQLFAYFRFKGYRPPPAFDPAGELLENDTDLVDNEIEDDQSMSNKSISHKRKHDSNDSLQPTKKERSLSELMGDMAYSPDDEDESDGKLSGKPISSSSARKRTAVDSLVDGSDKKISNYAAKVSTTTPKPSFKIGECIRRVASQLTGSASYKSSSDQPSNVVHPQTGESSRGRSMVVPKEHASLDEMLLQLQLAAQNPREGHNCLSTAVSFFSSFRNSVVSGRRPNSLGGRPGGGRKRKTSQAAGGTAEDFEFDDPNDSYWTDRIVQNYADEQLLQNGENGGGEYHLVTYDPDRSVKSSRKPKKRYSTGSYEMAGEEINQEVDRKRREMSPAELILNFAEGSLPSEINLNKIFRRFGTLKEAETEVDYGSRRAKVVFKRGSDAEVAYSSAGTFNIFGSLLVTYELSYSPSSSVYKPLLPATDPNLEEAT